MIFLQKLLHHSCFHITLGITLFLFSLNTNHCMIIFEGERKRRNGDIVFVYIFRDTSRYLGMHFPYTFPIPYFSNVWWNCLKLFWYCGEFYNFWNWNGLQLHKNWEYYNWALNLLFLQEVDKPSGLLLTRWFFSDPNSLRAALQRRNGPNLIHR